MDYGAHLSEARAAAVAGRWAAARTAFAAALEQRQTAEALDGLAATCWWLGETREAIGLAQRAYDAYERVGECAEAARVALDLCVWFLTNLDNDVAARGWLACAEHQAERADDPLVSGWVDLFRGYLAEDSERARGQIQRAHGVAGALGDHDLATMALADLGLWYVSAGEPERGLAMLDEALAAAFSRTGIRLEIVVWSSCNMLAACSLLDDLHRAAQWVREAERFMAIYGCPFLQARCRAHYGRVLVAAGRWDQAEAELAAALAMAADTGLGPRIEAITALAELRLAQGSPDEAAQLLADLPPTADTVLVDAATKLARGCTAEAVTVLRGALALDPARVAHVALLVEALLAADDLDAAAALLAPGSPIRDTAPLPREAARLARAAGLVAVAGGDRERARTQFAFALETFSRLELPYEVACTELDLAELLAEDDPAAAIARASYALRGFRELGAATGVARTGALLRRLGATPGPGPRDHGLLTRREQEVLDLLGHGLSNPEIAERLFLSTRTVGHHVSSILRKLGLRSRTEAAAYTARKGAPRR